MTAVVHKTPTIDEFKNNPEPYIEQAQSTDAFVLLAEGETPKLVLQSVSGYQSLLDRIEHLENVVALYQAGLQSERGQVRPAREALEELGRKHGFLR